MAFDQNSVLHLKGNGTIALKDLQGTSVLAWNGFEYIEVSVSELVTHNLCVLKATTNMNSTSRQHSLFCSDTAIFPMFDGMKLRITELEPGFEIRSWNSNFLKQNKKVTTFVNEVIKTDHTSQMYSLIAHDNPSRSIVLNSILTSI